MPNSAVLGGLRRFGAILILGGGGELGSNWGQKEWGSGKLWQFFLNVTGENKTPASLSGLREFT